MFNNKMKDEDKVCVNKNWLGTYVLSVRKTHTYLEQDLLIGKVAEKQETNDMNSSAKIAYIGPNRSGDSDTVVDSSSEDGDTGLSANQGRLLYLIHLHTAKAKDRDSKDRWLRKQSLDILIYEGVISGKSMT